MPTNTSESRTSNSRRMLATPLPGRGELLHHPLWLPRGLGRTRAELIQKNVITLKRRPRTLKPKVQCPQEGFHKYCLISLLPKLQPRLDMLNIGAQMSPEVHSAYNSSALCSASILAPTESSHSVPGVYLTTSLAILRGGVSISPILHGTEALRV